MSDAISALPDVRPLALGNPRVLLGIATSRWSHAQRQALCWVHMGQASTINDFVPVLWNREVKAKKAIYELEKAQHLTRDAGRLFLIESSFVSVPAQTTSGFRQTAFPEAPGLGYALADSGRLPPTAEACPVSDGTGCPSSDGPSVLSRTGQAENPDRDRGSGLSCPGQDRSSRSIEVRSIEIDDRSRPRRDGEIHREFAMELLAKNPRLLHMRKELLGKKTPTAQRFWSLFASNPLRAAQLVQSSATARKPIPFLNSCLQREAASLG